MNKMLKKLLIIAIIIAIAVIGYYGYQEFKKIQALRMRGERVMAVAEPFAKVGEVATAPLKIIPGIGE